MTMSSGKRLRRFDWRGDWQTSTSYRNDDIVKYGANTYLCTTQHTSSGTTLDDKIYFIRIRIRI